jgi:hypothetical protein
MSGECRVWASHWIPSFDPLGWKVKAQPSKYNAPSLWEVVETVTLTRQIKKLEYSFGSRNSAEVQLQKLVPRIK